MFYFYWCNGLEAKLLSGFDLKIINFFVMVRLNWKRAWPGNDNICQGQL